MPELELEPESHRYTLDGVQIPGCTQVLAAMGATPGFNFLTAEQLEFYRSRGHAVHKAVELSIRGELDKRTLDKKEVRPYLIGWERFCNDHKVDVWDFEEAPFVERPLHHPYLRYGVTPDIVAYLDGPETMIEIKATSAHAPATGLQLAAQAMAVHGVYRAKGIMLPDFDRVGLRLLREEPYYDLRYYTERSDGAVWLGALNLFNWLTKHKLLKQNGGR